MSEPVLSTKQAASQSLLSGLADASYLRERSDPRRGDTFYLHLSDLLLVLRGHATEARITILDFGCGGSPYRFLFPNADYKRADFKGVPGVDLEIEESGQVAATDRTFDLVLSTQVLEHCPSPLAYLRECHRVLKPQGRLVLSTHGLFEEHGCPNDFTRWTEDGLRRLLAEASFRVTSVSRLTMGPRAVIMLLQRSVERITAHGRSLPARGLWLACRRFLLLRRRLWDPLLDTIFPEYRVSGEARLPGDHLYIALLAAANRL